MTWNPLSETQSVEAFADAVAAHVERGSRFAGLFGVAEGAGTRLIAVLARQGGLDIEETVVRAGVDHYRSLVSRVPAAQWYEREIRDLFDLASTRHVREPLVFPFAHDATRPRPGSGGDPAFVEPDLTPLRSYVRGEGVFTIPYGPVRSGVFESVEYIVETSGEDIHHLRARFFYKHRGIESRFEGQEVHDGVLLAERFEGVATVAHAIAYCSAIEAIAGVDVPTRANLVRVVHAELERIANHLESTSRHCEAAGQAVAVARMTLHKELVQRLRARLCGSRFSRGVVVPGGVSSPSTFDVAATRTHLDALEHAIRDDIELLMATPSFLDRLRGTGVLEATVAHARGALGPVGRGSGEIEDVRSSRPYGAYGRLDRPWAAPRSRGDALARQLVRDDEIASSFRLIVQALDLLNGMSDSEGREWRVAVDVANGRSFGWAEAPQGEVLYMIEIREGRLARVKVRSASFHNLALLPLAFPNDILTDFAFIEASFGLSIAGAAG